MEKTNCLLCGADDSIVAGRVADRTVPCTNVLCRRCGLVYQNPRMTAAEARAYYAQEFSEVRHKVDSLDAAEERMKKKKSIEKYERFITWILPYLGPGTRVLDVGSSYGYLLEAIRRKSGAKVFGVEPSVTESLFANERLNIPTFRGTADEYLASRPSERYDLIILHHVLEHFLDPVAGLHSLAGLLAPGGAAYVAVPDVMRPGEPAETFFQVPHLVSFSPWTLCRAAEKAGFKIVAFSRSLEKIGMHAILVRADDARPAVPVSAFTSGQRPPEVLWSLRRTRAAYAILRAMKRTLLCFLPQTKRDRMGAACRRALRFF